MLIKVHKFVDFLFGEYVLYEMFCGDMVVADVADEENVFAVALVDVEEYIP